MRVPAIGVHTPANGHDDTDPSPNGERFYPAERT